VPVHFPLKLVSSRMLAPTIRHFAFTRDDGQPLDFIPGQFIQVHFTYADGTATKRSYSIATVREGDAHHHDQIELAVSYVPGGAATNIFEHLGEGDTIEASGPFGRFCLMPRDENRRYLLIATGTGVTPYRSMLPELKRQMDARGVEVVLLFGARLRRGQRELPLHPLLQPRTAGRAGRTRFQGLRAGRAAAVGARRRGRHRLPVRQPEHGRHLLRGAQGARLPGAAHPPREVRQQPVRTRSG
jgi:hypothetical protein